MSQAPHPLPMAGDYLVATFADLMHSARFRKHVWAKMQLAERRRLEALRLQALYGDAPDHSQIQSNYSVAATPAAAAPVKEAVPTSTGEEAAGKGKENKGSASPPAAASSAPSPPRWFDIAGRARYNAWVALRGCMSADVASECFCAEFLGLIKKYPHPALLPPVEAALSTAQGLAQRTRSARRLTGLQSGSGNNNNAVKEKASSSALATTPVLEVRALQGDPAALALLWVCRAFRITCEFIVEPLSKAMGGRRAPTSSPSTLNVRASNIDEKSAIENSAASTIPSNPYLPYTMADACYPFSATLSYPGDAAVTASAAAATTVTTPEAAFVLLADTFLAAYPHWMGVPSDLPATAAAPAAAPLLRCAWLDELQHITRHLRTPILALLVHHATQPSTGHPTAAEPSADRSFLLRAVAAHLHRYEAWTMERVVHRRVGQAQSVLSPLLASTAVVDALQHAYAPDAKAVTAADVFVASCGYVLCTHPFCADVFPLLRVPVEVPDGEQVRSRWSPAKANATASPAVGESNGSTSTSSNKTSTTNAAAASVPTRYAPWALPLYLSGVPAEFNEKINQLLRRESKGAVRHERQQQPARLLINDGEPHLENEGHKPQRSAGYYEVSSASMTKEAAEAVQQLMLSRMSTLRNDDLQRGDVVGSHSSLSGAPFLVLTHVFALTWALAQEQVPAFPYFMLDGNPDHFGGFSFLAEDGARAGKKSNNAGGGVNAAGPSPRQRPRFQVSLAPAAPLTQHPSALSPSSSSSVTTTSNANPAAVPLPTLVPGSSPTLSASSLDGGASVESQLRSGLQAITSTLLRGFGRLTGQEQEKEASRRRNSGVHATHVLRSEGEEKSNLQAPPEAAESSAARL